MAKIEPSSAAEYRCGSGLHTNERLLVSSRILLHMLKSPECINEEDTWIHDQIPKRICGKLRGDRGSPAEGWGLYFEEGWDVDAVLCFAVVSLVLASLLFGICWNVLEKDIQGAFGVASYVVTLSGMIIALIVRAAGKIG